MKKVLMMLLVSFLSVITYAGQITVPNSFHLYPPEYPGGPYLLWCSGPNNCGQIDDVRGTFNDPNGVIWKWLGLAVPSDSGPLNSDQVQEVSDALNSGGVQANPIEDTP